eukprot:6490142-Amphidinium_carterae.1
MERKQAIFGGTLGMGRGGGRSSVWENRKLLRNNCDFEKKKMPKRNNSPMDVAPIQSRVIAMESQQVKGVKPNERALAFRTATHGSCPSWATQALELSCSIRKLWDKTR